MVDFWQPGTWNAGRSNWDEHKWKQDVPQTWVVVIPQMATPIGPERE
jgi:hypothetical protein